MSGLPREIVKWLQSLDLSKKIKVPKWDLASGYLVGEILCRYFPIDIKMYCFDTFATLKNRLKNWEMIRECFIARRLNIAEVYIDGTIHTREGAANLLLEEMYKALTHRMVKKVAPDIEHDFTDHPYQVRLPLHARSTACTSVKNNLRMTEVIFDGNPSISAHKAEKIINNHIDQRIKDRQDEPQRFGIEPTLAEQCVRQIPVSKTSTVETLKSGDFANTNEFNAHSELSVNTGPRADLAEILK